MNPDARYDVCIVGGGPAGSVTALRLAKLGYRICVIERFLFPRPHVGESLTPGAYPILDVLGLRGSILALELAEPEEMRLRWATPTTERLATGQRGTGLMVDRAVFDTVLLQAAAAAGARVFQPAQVRSTNQKADGWHMELAVDGRPYQLNAAFVVDATGRKGFFRRSRRRLAPRTVALCGYLDGRKLPRATLVEAFSDGWCWAAPIPGGLLSTMVFLDPASIRYLRPGGLETLWRSYLAKTALFADLACAPAVHPPTLCDASAYYDQHPVGQALIRVGEANFALDPLSSTGVEKAMQTGLFAALVLHTTMLRPERAGMCERFYRDRSQEAVAAHIQWSSNFYAAVERFRHHSFWAARAVGAKYRPEGSSLPPDIKSNPISLGTRMRVSDLVRLIEEPCIIGDEIRSHAALLHPSLGRPVAFVEGAGIDDLLRPVSVAADLEGILTAWSRQMPPAQARRAAAWMLKNQILEPVAPSS
ncbi:tryptophan 7-halogenase [Bradyrhizobium sp. 166]|uniref:flavin-dependent monooxygenase QhpG n=1 Tax=Bradyrhizobium sp. 166 TaxID=2782638 RepID=UPI001FF72451|nr:FAD-dependent oxidoreductase [Bradyrhizobium sp. 166]MCK1604751.1 tryptophan 7-halogenase [Bradyrhizobium sp. 166]